MPVSCSTATALTGQDGALYFTPPATSFCLLDKTDFPIGADITVPNGNDYRVNDPVTFAVVNGAKLDTALTAATTYYVKSITKATASTPAKISVAATAGGVAITLKGDGGATGADTAGGHINIKYAEAMAVCQVTSVDLNLTRAEIDTTSLPCGVKTTAGGVKLASFKTYQPGYADGSGSMTVRFTTDNTALSNRLIQGALFTNQGGATLKVYLNAVADATGLKPDDTKSLLVEFPVSLMGFSFSVTSADSPTEASLSFRLSGAPTQMLGL